MGWSSKYYFPGCLHRLLSKFTFYDSFSVRWALRWFVEMEWFHRATINDLINGQLGVIAPLQVELWAPSYNWIRGPPCMILSLHLQNKSFKRKKNKVDVKFCCLLWGVHSVLIKRASLRPGIPRQSKVPEKKHKHNSNTKSKKLQNNSNKNLPNFQNII